MLLNGSMVLLCPFVLYPGNGKTQSNREASFLQDRCVCVDGDVVPDRNTETTLFFLGALIGSDIVRAPTLNEWRVNKTSSPECTSSLTTHMSFTHNQYDELWCR
ncbi:hypothetical protein F5050DRAFT_838509 [Lentinula boryana]|uniref:Secreted protein n=1 Tax=Lentinula boryana TaxID=40481 RepID=A0ABQ8QMR5_9AGAR|nr:hypothetical protein F5050DRAFT_838509 [Lentinula boryana]